MGVGQIGTSFRRAAASARAQGKSGAMVPGLIRLKLGRNVVLMVAVPI